MSTFGLLKWCEFIYLYVLDMKSCVPGYFYFRCVFGGVCIITIINNQTVCNSKSSHSICSQLMVICSLKKKLKNCSEAI